MMGGWCVDGVCVVLVSLDLGGAFLIRCDVM